MALRAFLDLPNGMSVRIGPAGLLVGRHHSCDVQLADESASRRHALLRVGSDGVELVVLGKRAVHVGDRECTTSEPLRDGDRLRFPGCEATIRVESFEESVPITFCLRRGSERIPIRATPFIVGTAATANVVIAGWPAEALRFRIAQGVLHVEATAAGAQCDGAPLEPDVATAVAIGSVITYRGDEVAIEQAAPGDQSTVADAGSMHPRRVVIERLPRGGRVTFTFADGDRAVYLPGRRFRLVSALLAPPAPHAAGDFVPDHDIIPSVWNDDDLVGGRLEINVLLTRCRHDLVAAGIAASKLLERAPGGLATRIVLAPNAEIKHSVD